MSKQQQTNIADPAAAYERLKIETAAMLGFDVSDLTLTQGLQLDLVSLLRLEVDTMQGAALSGEQVDLQRLAVAHGMLQKMLPPQALVAPAQTTGPNYDAALLQVDAMLNGLIAPTQSRRARPRSDAEWRDGGHPCGWRRS